MGPTNPIGERTLLTGGTVLVLDGATPAQEAMVIENGRVAATGARDEMKRVAGAKAENVDLRGATAMPGLIDSHPHLLHLAMLEQGVVDLFDAIDHEDIIRRIQRFAENTPPGQWILTTPIGEPHYFIRRSYLDLEERRMPDRAALDRATTRHPVLVQAWPPKTPNVCAFNSLGLAQAGIGRITPDRVCNVMIEKDESGRPTGIVRGSVNNYYNDDPFWLQIQMRLPRIGNDALEAAVLSGMKLFNRLGVTSIYEAHAMNAADIDAFRTVRERGEATVRVLAALEFSNGVFSPLAEPSEEELLARLELAKSMRTVSDDLLRIEGLSLGLGGPCWQGYARVYEPYKDPYGNPTRGKTFLSLKATAMAMEFCLRHRLRLNLLTGGYRDHDDYLALLDSFAGQYDLESLDWVVQHCILTSQAQARRYAELGLQITASTSFLWGMGDIYVERMGTAVFRDFNPLKRFFDLGLNVSCGSDWGPKNIFEHMQFAETREFGGTSRRDLSADQAITREQSLLSWTRNCARLMRWNDIGSLSPGFQADITIVDRNPLTCPVDDLPGTTVLRTLLGGRIVHDSEQL
ncbi:MAG: amidohydrolase [Candidatus Binataceae bacterium]